MSEYKSECGHLEQMMGKWEHPFEITELTDLDTGHKFPQFIVRLHHVTDEGRVKNSHEGRSWTKINYCPWCGIQLPNQSDRAATPKLDEMEKK